MEKPALLTLPASSAGASLALQPVLAEIEQKIAENKGKPDVIKVLRGIKKTVETIKSVADRGLF